MIPQREIIAVDSTSRWTFLRRPIDALLLNRLVSLTAATSGLWAWIAVLTTAALSLWRIRAVHSNPHRHGPTDPGPPIKDPEVRADVPAVDDAEAE
ncbi:hypothetical protein QJS10_CPA09g00055 [Acorus calamus]|uniref:Uncharacterized protein n=1 Tax=Acorus calamus TaxID=4465 RepID=A0AAV9E682_ACOCL|nr:hypothetical protein QJS10_CPA09g00055 [Acorus calamus]